MTPTRILFAVRIGAEDWQEQLITERPERIAKASAWALANGFDRLRIATIADGPPDFRATLTKTDLSYAREILREGQGRARAAIAKAEGRDA